MSHPVWVRGLKPPRYCEYSEFASVAPRVGAWIETDAQEMLTGTPLSHPVWVRGLKRTIRVNEASEAGSHPVWVRGLKQSDVQVALNLQRRTPCGCVD